MPLEKPTTYSAPRRFDLATLLVVTTAYALLFAGMKALDFREEGFYFFAGMITFVGAAQSMFDAWQKPRTVSMLAGLLLYVVFLVWDSIETGSATYPGSLLCGMIMLGGIIGYFCGMLVGSVFLVADYLRQIIPGYARRNNSDEVRTVEESPWDD